MPTFTTFSDLLPDPNNKINNAGAVDATGSAGPGFAKIKFTAFPVYGLNVFIFT